MISLYSNQDNNICGKPQTKITFLSPASHLAEFLGEILGYVVHKIIYKNGLKRKENNRARCNSRMRSRTGSGIVTTMKEQEEH